MSNRILYRGAVYRLATSFVDISDRKQRIKLVRQIQTRLFALTTLMGLRWTPSGSLNNPDPDYVGYDLMVRVFGEETQLYNLEQKVRRVLTEILSSNKGFTEYLTEDTAEYRLKQTDAKFFVFVERSPGIEEEYANPENLDDDQLIHTPYDELRVVFYF